jgi:hypothetical protein
MHTHAHEASPADWAAGCEATGIGLVAAGTIVPAVLAEMPGKGEGRTGVRQVGQSTLNCNAAAADAAATEGLSGNRDKMGQTGMAGSQLAHTHAYTRTHACVLGMHAHKWESRTYLFGRRPGLLATHGGRWVTLTLPCAFMGTLMSGTRRK